MAPLFWFLRFTLIIIFSFSGYLYANEDKPTIGIAKSGWAPFLFVEEDLPQGFLVDYLNLAAEKSGITIDWKIVGDRAELIGNVNAGHYDYFLYGGNPKAYPQFVAGKALFPRYISAFSRKGTFSEPLTNESLLSITVAAPQIKALTNRYPDLKIHPTDSIKQALIAVATGKADVMFADHAVATHAIASALLPEFDIEEAPSIIQDSYFPVRMLYNQVSADKWMTSMEEGFSNISQAELLRLQQKWRSNIENRGNNQHFTAEELEWIENNKTIKVGAYTDIPPLNFVKNGELLGYSIDYLELIGKITGLNFEYEARDSWSEQLEMAANRHLDLLQVVRQRSSISEFMLFTQPYLSGGATVLYGRDGHPKVNSINRVIDKTIAVQRDYLEQVYLSENYPDLDLKVVDSTQGGLNAVLTGEADLFICQSNTCDSYIYQNFLSNLSVVGHLGIADLENANQARFAIRKDWPLLKSIFDKAISAIPKHELVSLGNEWFNRFQREQLLIESLTEAEKKWISGNKRLAFALPLKLPPFAFVDDGEPKGIANDIVERFESEYAIDAHYTHYSSWTDIVEAVKNGEIDFVPSMNVTEERKKSLLFTNPFLDMRAVILTKQGKELVVDLAQASGKKLGMARSASWLDDVKRDYPNIEIIEYSKLDDTLVALSNEEIDFTLISPFVAKYSMTALGINDLVQSGTTPYKQQVAIAVHPSKPELVSLFNKLIASIDSAQIGLILDKWNNLQVVEKKDWLSILTLAGTIVFFALFIVLLFSYIKRKQGLEVISKFGKHLENAQRVAQLGSWDVDQDNKIISLSTEAANILNVAETKTISRIEYAQLIIDEDRKHYIKALDNALKTGLLNVEYRIKVNGNIKWVKEVSELVFSDSGQFLSASTTIQDISEFKQQQEELIERQEELRELTSKLLSVQEEERKRVARELHDDLSQRLAVLSIDLGALHNRAKKDEDKLKIQQVKNDIVGIAEDTHSLSRRLHPSIIDDLGLIEALRSEIDNYQRREEIKVEFFSTLQTLDLDKDVELVIFRVLQEALRNVAKYSEASTVKVSLASIQGSLFLQIQDDGMGFDVEAARKAPGLGLKSMMERARLINAQFNISSKENHGVNIELQVPLNI